MQKIVYTLVCILLTSGFFVSSIGPGYSTTTQTSQNLVLATRLLNRPKTIVYPTPESTTPRSVAFSPSSGSNPVPSPTWLDDKQINIIRQNIEQSFGEGLVPIPPYGVGPKAPTLPRMSLSVGAESPYGDGKYLLWIKTENVLYLVETGHVVARMRTTDNDQKTPPGDYLVQYKLPTTLAVADLSYVLYNFVAFYRRPGGNGSIGVHAIPEKDGHLAQDPATLGYPGYVSDGCLRVSKENSKTVYDFAEQNMIVRVR